METCPVNLPAVDEYSASNDRGLKQAADFSMQEPRCFFGLSC
jgi:hypothetical protein